MCSVRHPYQARAVNQELKDGSLWGGRSQFWSWLQLPTLRGNDEDDIKTTDYEFETITPNVSGLELPIVALLLLNDARADVALCCAMAQCIAAMPWMKVLNLRRRLKGNRSRFSALRAAACGRRCLC